MFSQRLHVATYRHPFLVAFVEQGVEFHILVKGKGVHDEFLDALRHISLTFRPHGIVEHASRPFAQECAQGTEKDAETVWSVYDGALPAIVLSCVALMLAAAVLAALLTKALVQPVLNMTEDLDHIQENVPYRELIPFAESIHSDRILRENNEKMRQEFTANVSHELKTPLTSISGYAELIETGIAKPEDVPDFGRKIHSEATRMIQLVNDILQLSKLDTVSEMRFKPVPPAFSEIQKTEVSSSLNACTIRARFSLEVAPVSM